MPSELAFPLAMPLGGVLASDVRSRPMGQGLWLVSWRVGPHTDNSYMIFIDGNHWGNVVNQTSVLIQGEPNASPIVQIAQYPAEWGDPGFSRPSHFTTFTANKIEVPWDPPASVVDVDRYRVYWDNGTGTVQFTDEFRIAEVEEDGSTSYSIFTDQLVAGTYKFVVRTVDKAGNESSDLTEFSVVLNTFPGLVTGEAIAIIAGPRATITWTDPSDIGSGDVQVFDNGGSTNLFPDYDTVQATIPAGTQTFTSPVLADGTFVFGLRVSNGTVREVNTYVLLVVRIESGAEVTGYPSKPELELDTAAGGKVLLTVRTDPISSAGQFGQPVKAQFFTNDGAGGAIDFGTPLSPGFVNLARHGPGWYAALVSVAFGETARKFAARVYTTGGVASVNSDEVTITPDNTLPPKPLNVVPVAVRN